MVVTTMDPEISKMFDEMKSYLDKQISQTERHCNETTDLKINALKEATTLAKDSMEIRLEGMNRFREDLREQAKTLYSRQEHDLYAAKVTDQIQNHQSILDQLKGKAEQSAVNIALLLAAIATILSLIDFITHIGT